MFKRDKEKKKPTFWGDILSLILITAIGGLMHFTWERIEGIGYLRWAAVLVPINESNWEHVKMGAWPLLVWALVVLAKDKGIGLKRWLMSAALSIWSAFIVMFAVHSAIPLSFGQLGMVQYVGSFTAGIAHGIMAFRISARSASAPSWWLVGFLLLIAMFAMIIAFTYYPPLMPLFQDSLTGSYGLVR